MPTKMPTKKTTKNADASTLRKGEVLVLRTCDKDLKGHGGFQWPESGPVKCADFNPVKECGQGLHGLLWGEGATSYFDAARDAKWLLVAVREKDVISLGDKVKFPSGRVVFVGERDAAVALLQQHVPKDKVVCYALVTAGDDGTATAGDYGTATAGDRGTATAGNYGTATAGDDGTLVLSYYSKRRRLMVAYVGEDGIEPNVAYKLDAAGKFVKAGGEAK